MVSASPFKGPMLAFIGAALCLFGALWAIEADRTDQDVCVIQNCTATVGSTGTVTHAAGELQSDKMATFYVSGIIVSAGIVCLLVAAAQRWD